MKDHGDNTTGQTSGQMRQTTSRRIRQMLKVAGQCHGETNGGIEWIKSQLKEMTQDLIRQHLADKIATRRELDDENNHQMSAGKTTATAVADRNRENRGNQRQGENPVKEIARGCPRTRFDSRPAMVTPAGCWKSTGDTEGVEIARTWRNSMLIILRGISMSLSFC